MPQLRHHFWQSNSVQKWRGGFWGQEGLYCRPSSNKTRIKNDRFMLECIIFQRNGDKQILRFVERNRPLNPHPFSLSASMHMKQPHAHNSICTSTQSADCIYSLYLKPPHKNTSAYGAHFCTSGLMLLSSFFVLSIIVLNGNTKRDTVSMLLFYSRKWNTGAIVLPL